MQQPYKLTYFYFEIGFIDNNLYYEFAKNKYENPWVTLDDNNHSTFCFLS